MIVNLKGCHMKNRVIKLILYCAIVSLSQSFISADPYQDEVERLRKKSDRLERENTALKVKQAGETVVGYFAQLQERQNKPENIEEYLKKVKAARKYAEKTGDDKILKKVTNQGYKKSWWDRNPFKGDLLFFSVPAVLISGIIFYVVNHQE